jgi:hypothetical protein
VRRGYRPTPLWSKILFRYNLLCDNCNWEFTGFAVPGTVTAKPTKRPKKNTSERKNESSDNLISDQSASNLIGETVENLVVLDNLPSPKKKAGKTGKKGKK